MNNKREKALDLISTANHALHKLIKDLDDYRQHIDADDFALLALNLRVLRSELNDAKAA